MSSITGFAQLGIVTLFVESLFYGLYLATLAHCLRWLLYEDEGWKVRHRISWLMFSTTILMFLLLTIDLWLDLRIVLGPSLETNVLEYIALDVVVSAIAIFLRLIFDAVMIYRCWIVYAKSWRITCLPFILWLSCFISATLGIYYNTVLVHPKDSKTAFFASSQDYKLLILFYSCNITINIYSTFAIVYRILTVSKGDGAGSSQHLHKLSRILIESGALYTFTSLLVLATQAASAMFVYDLKLASNVVGTINFEMAGICFNLILIRVGHTRTHRRDLSPGQQSTNKMTLSTLQFYISHTSTNDSSVIVPDEERAIGT